MARKRTAEELTVDELRHLLVSKRRAARQDRLDHFRKTGRVISVVPDPGMQTPESLSSGMVEAVETETVVVRKVSPRKRLLDRALLLVEVLAVIGLLAVLFQGSEMLNLLNREVANSMILPTLTPTPLISAVVLPSGHTPPDGVNTVRPNDAEIPEHLRPLVQSLANLPVPTPSPEQAVRIQIPAIKVDAPVVMGDGWDQLKKGVAQRAGTPNPGKDGNLVLSAHNDVFGEIFRELDRLKPGDEIVLLTNMNRYVYVVAESQIVLPTQVEVMNPTEDPVVTLISCYPYRVDNKRIIIRAELQGNS